MENREDAERFALCSASSSFASAFLRVNLSGFHYGCACGARFCTRIFTAPVGTAW